MFLLQAYVTPHTISSKPFFIIGLSALLLNFGFRIWRGRVEQEKQAGNPSTATKWLGWILKTCFVLALIFGAGLIGWMFFTTVTSE